MFSYTSTFFDDPPQVGRAIDVWLPQMSLKPYALYFIHGGGWKMGHRENMHQIMYGFYQAGYPCVSVCYGLEGATISSQLRDVRQGLAIAQKQLRANGYDRSVVLYGSSAGAHLALLAGLAQPGICGESVPPDQSPVIAGIVASCPPTTLQPWDNMFPESWRCIQNAVGRPYKEAPELYELLSPATHAHPQSPPLLFLLGECEHMFPNKQAVALTEQLRSQGHPALCHIYEQAEHGFFYALTRPAQKAAFRDMMNFLKGLPDQQPVGGKPQRHSIAL